MMTVERDDVLHVLEYDRPAAEWTQALPLGDGRHGAMCFGGLERMRIQLNDDTAWSGSPRSEQQEPRVDADHAAAAIAQARRALRSGRPQDADAPLRSLQHRHSQAYVAFADLMIEVRPERQGGRVMAYRRRLDLRTATHTASGAVEGTGITQRTWISAEHGVLVHEIEADAPVEIGLGLSTPLRERGRLRGQGRMSLLLRMPNDVRPPHDGVADPVMYSDDPQDALEGAVSLSIEHDGHEEEEVVRGVRRMRILLATETTFVGIGAPPSGDAESARSRAEARIADAALTAPSALREGHLRDHARLYDRVELALGAASRPPLDVPARLRNLRVGDDGRADAAADPALLALLFHYGRYLLICSSRPGALPATLQGIWNEDVAPVWSSNYTTNINLQMNYWASAVTALPECEEPLRVLTEAVAEHGRETARRLYGARGWVLHHNTDAWAYTQQIGHGRHDPAYVFWPMGGVWLVVHLLESAAFAERGPALRGLMPLARSCAEFVLDWLHPADDGRTEVIPSTSPENTYRLPGGGASGLTRSSAMDVALVRALLQHLVDAMRELGDGPDDLLARAETALAALPEVRIADGTVVEWAGAERAVDPHHRHPSPLVFLYPLSGSVDEDLARACRVFLDRRGDESTGWSLVWKTALRARLADADAVRRLVDLLVRDMDVPRGPFSGGLYPNLFAAHPPFQIDANLGFPAAMAEALLQSHQGEIHVLPAWPAAWGGGAVRGLVARPGVDVDIRWRIADGHVHAHEVVLTARHRDAVGEHTVRIGDRRVAVLLAAPGAPVTVAF